MNQKHHRLAITPLSPVHMGTDADYEPTGYVIDGGTLFEFDGLAALRALSETERGRLDRILSGKPTDRMLREVQGFFYSNRERLIACSRRQVRVSETIEAFYKDRVGQVVQHERGGGKVQNRLEIERTAWNPVSGQPILPGSGLKGAIRTALLDRINGGRGLRHKERNRDLQVRLFEGEFATDPMRLIRVGDAALAEETELPTEVLFALNRKKHPVEKDGTLVQSQAEQRGPGQLLECLPPLHPRAFSGSLAIQELGHLGNDRTTPKLRFTLGDIAAACNRFYRPILDRELQLLHRRGYVDTQWVGQIDTLLQQLQPAFEAGQAFLLRVGRHSGAESVTLNGVRSIKIMKGKDERPAYLDSTKTFWLAGHERQTQRDLLPFGWLLVEIDPERESPWKGLATPEEARAWLDATRRRIETLRQAHERETRERQERQRQRQAEEAAQREKAEREQEEKERRLARLTPEQRKVEELVQAGGASPMPVTTFLFNQLEEGPDGWSDSERLVLADRLREMMREAGEWREKSAKKRPEKDKPYQRTLKVMAIIETLSGQQGNA